MSFFFRNPNTVKLFNAWAKENVLNGCLKDDYDKYRMPHEPVSFEEFKVALHQPGMTELERFPADVNRNSKGVPKGAQIRFGLF
jgi:hypothetical protein